MDKIFLTITKRNINGDNPLEGKYYQLGCNYFLFFSIV